MNQCLYCRWVFYYVFYRTNKKRTSRQIHADNVVRSDFCRQSCVMTRLYRWLKCLKHIIVFVLSMLSKVEHEIKSAHIICKQEVKLLHTKFIFHKRLLLVNSAKSRSKVADISSDKRSSSVKPQREREPCRQTNRAALWGSTTTVTRRDAEVAGEWRVGFRNWHLLTTKLLCD